MKDVFKKIYTTIWEEIFPGIEPLPINKFKQLYTNDLLLPKAYKSEFSDNNVFVSPEYGLSKFITSGEQSAEDKKTNWEVPKKKILSLNDVLSNIKDIAIFRGGRQINSEMIEKSDDIYSSNFIYNSTHIYNCQKTMFSYNNRACEYMLASKGSGNSNFGIRVIDSGNVSNSFDVHWIGKSSNCFFCHDSSDLTDCMFCFHLASKQYCIANMQFEKDEYFKLKEVMLKEYFSQLNKPNPFITIKDL